MSHITEQEVLDLLTRLVEKSLVVYEEDEQGRGRFRLMETVRVYARDRLLERGESDALRGRHLGFFLRWAEDAERHLLRPEQAGWLQRLEIDHENLRAALEYCGGRNAGPEEWLRLAAALSGFWRARGHVSEGRTHCCAALAGDGAPTTARAKVWLGAGRLALDQDDYAEAAGCYQEGLRIFQAIEDLPGIAAALYGAGSAAWYTGDYFAASVCYRQSLAIRREVGDPWSIAYSLYGLGSVAHAQHDYPTAAAYYQESLEIRRQIGDLHGVAYGLNDLGWVARAEGNTAEAAKCYLESLIMFEELGDPRGSAYALNGLGCVAETRGEHAEAASYHEKSLVIFRQIGDRRGIGWSLHGLATVAASQGDHAAAATRCVESLLVFQEIRNAAGMAEVLDGLARLATARVQASDRERWAAAHRSARLSGAAEALRAPHYKRQPSLRRAENNERAAEADTAMDEGIFAGPWAEGRAMTMEQAVAYALEEVAD